MVIRSAINRRRLSAWMEVASRQLHQRPAYPDPECDSSCTNHQTPCTKIVFDSEATEHRAPFQNNTGHQITNTTNLPLSLGSSLRRKALGPNTRNSGPLLFFYRLIFSTTTREGRYSDDGEQYDHAPHAAPCAALSTTNTTTHQD
jgi:hypothetical protein